MKRFLFFFLLFTLINIPLGSTYSYLQSSRSSILPNIQVRNVPSNHIKQSDIPDFSQESMNITGGPGTYNLTATIQHSGIEATPGSAPISWEKNYTSMELVDGSGTLNESMEDLDLNGDGDKEDTFAVEWSHNNTRPYDATIDSIHIYSLIDSMEENYREFSYSIAGKSKVFILGNNKHVLYYCDEFSFEIGFYTELSNIPSPSLDLWVMNYNPSTNENLSVSNFQINGEAVQLNNSYQLTTEILPTLPLGTLNSYIIPHTSLIIDTGELIVFSCTIDVYENISAEIAVNLNWSPDGIIRYRYQWWYESLTGLHLEPKPMTSNTDTTSPNSSPGFSFTICLFALILPIVFLYINECKRRYG
jgi:hypothetical protein